MIKSILICVASVLLLNGISNIIDGDWLSVWAGVSAILLSLYLIIGSILDKRIKWFEF